VLYVGNVKPHKNLERLIEAVHHLHENGYDALKLLSSAATSPSTPSCGAPSTHNLHRYVRFLGFVPDRRCTSSTA
jgi:glycosyltransferase involved in cell wall biosynthesis